MRSGPHALALFSFLMALWSSFKGSELISNTADHVGPSAPTVIFSKIQKAGAFKKPLDSTDYALKLDSRNSRPDPNVIDDMG